MKYLCKPIFVTIFIALATISVLASCGEGKSTAVSASWDKQLAVAQRAAQAVDPKTALIDVSTETSPANKDLQVKFLFFSPSQPRKQKTEGLFGTHMLVSLKDTDPDNTIQLNKQYEDSTWIPTESEIAQLKEQFSMIKISPAQALEQARPVWQSLVNSSTDPLIYVGSLLGRDYLLKAGLPSDKADTYSVAWSVSFLTSTPRQSVQILVDPATGEVLSHKQERY